MTTTTAIAAAPLVALTLRTLIGLLRANPRAWGALRPWMPLILVALSVACAVASHLAGQPLDVSALLAAGPAGAVVVEEVAATPKRRKAAKSVDIAPEA